MIYHLPKFLNSWSVNHKNYLWFISSASLASYAGSLVYAVLPVVIAATHGEWYAGVLISICNLFQAFLIDPIAGSLSDKIGSRRVLILGFIFGIIAGSIWLIYPINNNFVLFFFSFFLFLCYGFRGTTESYILKIAKKNEGGMLFGLFGNSSSMAIFLATSTLPFFVIAGKEILAAWTMIVIFSFSLLILFFLPNDLVSDSKSEKMWSVLNPWPAIKNGINFVKINNHYPTLALGATLFEGIFYGTIWLIFPLQMSKYGLSGENGLHLGVYDLVTAFFAGYAGYLADKYNWRHIHSLGWIFVILGLIALPFYDWPTWLIIIGFIIAIGNNLSYYSAAHALEANDIDHMEDGSFVGIKSIISSLGYSIAPLIAGFIYVRYGFKTSLSISSLICIGIALAMIWLTWNLENDRKKSI